MAIALDNATGTSGTGVSSLSWNHTVANQSDRLLFVAGNWGASSDYGPSGVTFNGSGTGWVQVFDRYQANWNGVSGWYLVAPSVGTFQVVVTYPSAPLLAYAASASFYGVHQSTPVGTPTTDGVTAGTIAEISVTSASGELVVGTVASDSQEGISIRNSGATLYEVENIGADCSYDIGTWSGASTVTVGWNQTVTPNSYAVGGVSVKPSSGGAEGHQPPVSPISFVGAGAQAVSTTSGGTVSAAWPAAYTATAGDLQVLIAAGKHNNGTSLAPNTPSGTGWTQIGTRFREVGTYDLQLTVWARILAGGESASTVTVPAAYSTTSGGLSAQTAIYRGVFATPEDAAAVLSDAAAATTWTPTGITTADDGAWVLSIVASADDNALGLLSGSEQGFAERMSGASYDTTSGGDHAVGLADKRIDSAGAVTCPTWNQTLVGTDAWAGITWAIRANWKSFPPIEQLTPLRTLILR